MRDAGVARKTRLKPAAGAQPGTTEPTETEKPTLARGRKSPGKPASPGRATKPAATASNGLAYGLLGSQVGFWVRRANLRVLQSYSEALGGLDLRPVEMTILVLLGNNKGLTQIALGSALDTDQSTMVSLLTRLEQRKLVVRRRLSTDRRFQVTSLSAAGSKLLGEVAIALRRHNDALLVDFTEDERQTFMEMLQRLAAPKHQS